MFNGKFEFNTVVGVGVTSIEIGLEVPIQPPFSPFTVMTSPSANELDEIDGVGDNGPIGDPLTKNWYCNAKLL